MAPGANNNQNNSNNNNNNSNNHNRQTGTKPKTKSSKKNSVPREFVAPTRRDLQQQLNVLVDWATVSGAAAVVQSHHQQQQQQHQHPHSQQLPQPSAVPGHSGFGVGGHQQNVLLKPRNNRTPGEGTCYEIDNLALQDNSRYIPVRPIVRRNLLSESTSCGPSGTDSGEPHNTAVGVVIPTTPNSAGLQQTFRLNDTGSSVPSISNFINNNPQAGVVHHRQNHILNPFHQQQQQQHQLSHQQLGNLRSSPLSSRVPDGASQNQLNLNKNSNHQQQFNSAIGGGVINPKANFDDKLNQIQEYIKLTTNLISSVQIDNLLGPRPQSVQSISTTHSATPSLDDIRDRMEGQSKNMQALKEQQAHLLRLQQAARLQLQEMEQIRQQSVLQNPVTVESFETVEQVQEGIGGIMDRMRVLATFIQNQQELGNLLGGDNEDVVNEQILLQEKFRELRDKKTQMHNLVSELQNLNVEASRQFDGASGGTTERSIPIELTNVPATAADIRKATKTFNQNGGDHVMMNGSRGGSITPKVENVVEAAEHDERDEDEIISGTADILNEKIGEINAMKSQLRRLKEMMDTVKLIEMKTGDSIDEEEDAPEDNEDNPDTAENSRSPSVASQISDHGLATGVESEDRQREHLNQRVEALHAMTRDLREQAKSIAAERDALKNAKVEIQKRRNNVTDLQRQADSQTAEKLTNHVASFASALPPGPKEREQMALKAELEKKKRELEQIEKMTQSIKKNTELSRRNTEVSVPPKVSSVSSADSLRSQSQPPVIPPPPLASAINNTSASNATNHSKNSADSGVTDIFANVRLESGSCQSSSTRSLNMVPPMPDICNRPDRYRKSEDAVGPSGARVDRTSPWPSHLFSGAGPSSSNTGPQSPHFHPFAVGSDIHLASTYPNFASYPAYTNLLPSHTPNSAPVLPPDPLMFQHFMQTQQMLMNSITQCNQLLWIQQREINNLNNAVLLLQERILSSGHNNNLLNDGHVPGAGAHIRAESTPPNNTMNTGSSFAEGSVYSRARSEQPNLAHQQQQTPSSPYHPSIPSVPLSHQVQHPLQVPFGVTSSNQFQTFSQSTVPTSSTPTTSQHPQFSVNAQIQRNNTNLSNASAVSTRNYRNLRHVNINTANNAIYEQQQLQQQQQHQSMFDHHTHSNNFMNLQNPLQNGIASRNEESQTQQPAVFNNASSAAMLGNNVVGLGPSNMINNLSNGGPTTAAATATTNQPQTNCQLNNLNNSNLTSNQQQQQALNNQVLPGVRANNYWDNFRSYSRQNLLSSNSCKSNEDSCVSAATGSCTNNINNQIQRNNSSNIHSNSNNNSNASCGNDNSAGAGCSSSGKYPQNFNRSNVNHHNVSDCGPSMHQTTSANQSIQQPQQQQQHYQSVTTSQPASLQSDSSTFQQHPHGPSTTSQFQQHSHHAQPSTHHHHSTLNQSNSFDLGELQFHTNPINLGLANKSQPKASGHKKYPLSLRTCRDASLGGEANSNFYRVGAHAEMVSDLNLATASNYQHDSKSTSKLFEALKENVYQEVKNLITANESRPHFLIQLFRELQLISSDPLRQRTLQSIQELYNRYIETTLQQEQHHQQQQHQQLQQQQLQQPESHVNNVGSNNLLTSTGGADVSTGSQPQQLSAENVEVVELEVSQNFNNVRQQQQGFQFLPSAESTPIAGSSVVKDGNELLGMASSEIINIIMGDIVGVINSVDYINDSVLCKIAGVIWNHATGGASGDQFHHPLPPPHDGLLASSILGPSMAAFLTQNESEIISREDFLRHLESWNRTDKDEFISNLENLLNNILLRSAAEGETAGIVTSSNLNGVDEEGQMRSQQLQHDSMSSYSNSAHNNTTGDVSTDNNETFPSYSGNENPFSPHTPVGAVGGQGRRVYGISESDKISCSNGISSSNGYASTTYDLAEADQVCDLDKSLPGSSVGAVGGNSSSRSLDTIVQPSGYDERWRVLQKKLDDDIVEMMERNRLAEDQQQQPSQQAQRGRPNEDWQDEDGDGNLDPEEKLPVFY
ncbi:uncharacterized protein LOC129743651 isoform X2 [Uranotaenia lowii]|uniref:uncharacterized protein LOC129743651 isoform X2 n=1 Tax=Uranotaenia lowii TaxID=190385 RepID=UPI0024798B8B|nr:uncharacterized protein LOC129743651 isoform X2 [Uranotaenia lowii]